MAGETTYGAGAGANLFDASRVTALFEATIADRDFSALAHPANAYLGDITGGQTAVSTIPIVNLTDDEFASLTEIEEMDPSDITSATAQITVSRRGLQRALSDMALSLDGTGALTNQSLADAMVVAANLTMLSLVCAAAASFTTVKGTSGATLTHATVRSAMDTMITGSVPGPYIMILSRKQYTEWKADFESLGGAIQMKTTQAAEMAMVSASSYKGSWDNVDVYVSDKVTDDATDYKGLIYGMGAIGWKSMIGRTALARDIVIDAGFIKIEAEREGRKALSNLIGNMWMGVSILQDAGGCIIRSGV